MTSEGNTIQPGGLFQGKTFWLSQNVPQRSRFRDMIQQNGGIVKLFEKDADIQLVDHTRKNLPPNTYSFRYVENSVRKGRLENLEVYRAGPSKARAVGATNIASRGHKIPYSLDDDQALWDWMQQYERDPNAPIGGNKIYQEFAAENPRHTYQSYRDRYLKRLRGHPRPGGGRAVERTQPARMNEESQAQSHLPQTSSATLGETTSQIADTPLPISRERKRRRGSDSHTQSSHGPTTTNEPHPKRVAVEINPEITIPPQVSTPPNESSNPNIIPQPKPLTATSSADGESTTNNGPSSEQNITVQDILLELPFFPASPEPEDDAPEQDIDTWIDERLRKGNAGSEEHIIEALRCTSMDPVLADKVLPYLTAGKGIPDNMRGVWTAQDDQCLKAQNKRDVERVAEKHGWDLFDSRWKYLDLAEAAGLESSTPL